MKAEIKNLCIAFSLTILFTCPLTCISVQASNYTPQTTTSNSEVIQPRAAIIEWVFRKDDDGKVYRRLYNHQTKEWIGDWILCN